MQAAMQSAFLGERVARPASASAAAASCAGRAAPLRVTAGGKGGGESRIGKMPLPIPKGVTVTLNGQHLAVKGPKGELSRTFPPEVVITELKDTNVLQFKARDDSRRAHQMHGLSRTLASNMVTGVVKEFETKLQLIGVGYKAALEGTKALSLNLGMTHPIKLTFPPGVSARVDSNINVSIIGKDKELVGNFAANIRAMRPPEPYKGKGVKYVDEVILRKEGKTGKGK